MADAHVKIQQKSQGIIIHGNIGRSSRTLPIVAVAARACRGPVPDGQGFLGAASATVLAQQFDSVTSVCLRLLPSAVTSRLLLFFFSNGLGSPSASGEGHFFVYKRGIIVCTEKLG